jgi:hypothetical protein
MTFERQRLSNRNFVSVSDRSAIKRALERANSKRLTMLLTSISNRTRTSAIVTLGTSDALRSSETRPASNE